MRAFAIVVSLACLSSPAFAQATDCSGGAAKKEFVVSYNAATTAISSHDFAGALGFIAAARPHATSLLQTSALNQIEVAALVPVDLAAAKQRMTTALNDPCLIPEVREKYVAMLAE